MFGMSGTELAIVLILALLLLGPSKLPEVARTLGKVARDFKRATNDIRGTVESEFYRMDDALAEAPKPPAVEQPVGAIPASAPAAPNAQAVRVEGTPSESVPSPETRAQKLAAELEADTRPADPEAKG
jgi:sec-independent protein translocase protein TatB